MTVPEELRLVMEALCKAVLVSYMDRNKVLKIPLNDSTKPDVRYLEEEFRREFQMRSNMCITFQKYDLEWEEYVDIEEFDVVQNKEKLKAVVHNPAIPSNNLSTLLPAATEV